jgi:hypothetical protein
MTVDSAQIAALGDPTRRMIFELMGEEFDAPFARLDWISRDRFDLQWHRHTAEWFCQPYPRRSD